MATIDSDGKIKLRRNVVSFELEGKLRVSVMSYRITEGVANSGKAVLTPSCFHTKHTVY